MDLVRSPILDEIAHALAARAQGWGDVFRRWFYFDTLEVYVRRNDRYVSGQFCACLVLASVEVKEPQRGQRHFSALLDGLAALAQERGEVLIIENVFSEIVRGACLRRGYIDVRGDGTTYARPLEIGDNSK